MGRSHTKARRKNKLRNQPSRERNDLERMRRLYVHKPTEDRKGNGPRKGKAGGGQKRHWQGRQGGKGPHSQAGKVKR